MTITPIGQINIRQKTAIAIGFYALSLMAIFFLAIKPSLNGINRLRQEIINNKKEVERGLQESQNLIKMKEKVNQIEPQINYLDSIFINQNRELEFITTLEEMASHHQVDQKISLTPPDKSQDSAFKKIPVLLTVSGKYESVMNYLISLETMNYYFNIKTIDLSAASASADLFSDGAPAPGRTHADGAQPKTGKSVAITINADTYWR
jgi:Tfp pilus assembly protein PilO